MHNNRFFGAMLIVILFGCSCATREPVDADLVRAMEDQFVLYAYATRREGAWNVARPTECGTAARLQRSAERGNPYAQHLLGMHYGWGVGVPRSEAKACEWEAAAAENGNAAAQYQLGRYLQVRGGPDALPQAKARLESAAGAGVAEAYAALSELAVLPDTDIATNEAVRLLEKAAELDDVWAPRLAMAQRGVFVGTALPDALARTREVPHPRGGSSEPKLLVPPDEALAAPLVANLFHEATTGPDDPDREIAGFLRIAEAASALPMTNAPVFVVRELSERIASPDRRSVAGAALRALRSLAAATGDEALSAHAAAEALRVARDPEYPDNVRVTALLVLEESATASGGGSAADARGRPWLPELREAAEEIARDRERSEWTLRLFANAVLKKLGEEGEPPGKAPSLHLFRVGAQAQPAPPNPEAAP